MENLKLSPDLTIQDNTVLRNLIDDVRRYRDQDVDRDRDEGYASHESSGKPSPGPDTDEDEASSTALPILPSFEPC